MGCPGEKPKAKEGKERGALWSNKGGKIEG